MAVSQGIPGPKLPEQVIIADEAFIVPPAWSDCAGSCRLYGATEANTVMLKQLVAGVVVAVTLTGAAVAGSLQDGMAAYSRGEYDEALRLWKQLAEEGLAIAQYNLGVMYATGRGVPRE